MINGAKEVTFIYFSIQVLLKCFLMYQQTVEKEGRSRKNIARLKKVVNDMAQARKDPEFIKSARAFVKYHSGSK